MAVNPQHVSSQQKVIDTMNKHHLQPPIVYLLLGVLCLAFWALGTSTQVLTSEAWMMQQSMKILPNATAYAQLWQVITTQHSDVPLAPFMFGWGVQLALIVTAIGVELPKKPVWRYRLAAWSSAALVIANSCGDWAGSAEYGFWGQMGFTAVIFFLTFVMLIFAIMAFKHAFALAKLHAEQEEAKKK
jgi:hypothetical protein